jgi:teichuronic acid biosynthesis glycosyltransferase TuaG
LNKCKSPLVSIIIPVYNAEKYIEQTIRSIFSQTYENYEILIVDDCSTDKSISIIKDLMKQNNRIKLLESEMNFGGPAKPRNIGLENAKGDYIAFLDADDVWLPGKLEKQLSILFTNEYDIVHTLAYTIDSESEKIGSFNNQKIYKKLKYFFSDFSILYFSNYININTVLMKNDFHLKFREDKYLIALEDMFFWIENLYINKKVYLIEEKLINYRIVNNSASDRSSDKSFRKLFYLYSLLLNEGKISLKMFSVCFLMNMFKISIRNIKNKF